MISCFRKTGKFAATTRAVFALLAFELIHASSGGAVTGQSTQSSRIEFDQAVGATKAAMLVDPVRAARFAREAEVAASTWPSGRARDVGIATARWLEGEAAFRANNSTTAEPLINAALATVLRATPDSKLHADLLLSHARIAVQRGQPQQGLNDLQHAYRIFAKIGDIRSEAKTLQSIGSIYQDAHDFERVLYYYKLANEMDPSDLTLRLSSSNNMANAYAQMSKLDEAEQEFKRALVIARRLQSQVLSVRILNNIADLQIDKHEYTAARSTLASGLVLALEPKAAGWLPVLLGTKARLELSEGQTAAALHDIEQAFVQSDRALADQSNRSLHLTAYRAYKSVGDIKHALEHYEIFKRMDDEARTLAASTNAALLAARFDFANQNARIAMLKTGQLQRDVALARVKARQSTLTLGTLLAVVTFAIIILFFYLRTLRISRNKIITANEQLEKTNSDLAEALSAKSQFLATTSHEIRTPLNGILGMTQVMLADGAMTGVQRERISLVDSAGRSMRSLVDDILSFAKMDAGMLVIEAAPVDPRIMLPELIELWRLEATEKKVGLMLDIDRIDGPVMTDPDRLRQIIFNLLSNAMKFTLEGLVRVNAYSELSNKAEMLIIDFQDTGVGIPASAFDMIFEPFRQLDTSTTRRFGGTGLGLAISRHLARALGGDITVSSITGAGSTFRLRLPYIRPSAVEKHEADSVFTMSGDQERRITIVSANPITRSLLRSALKPYFDLCDTCDTAMLEARLEQEGFDIVLLDAEPLIGERDKLDALVTRLSVSVRALAVLSPAIDETAGYEQHAGAADVIFKPVSVEILAARLTAIINATASHKAVGERLTMA